MAGFLNFLCRTIEMIINSWGGAAWQILAFSLRQPISTIKTQILVEHTQQLSAHLFTVMPARVTDSYSPETGTSEGTMVSTSSCPPVKHGAKQLAVFSGLELPASSALSATFLSLWHRLLPSFPAPVISELGQSCRCIQMVDFSLH